MVTITQQRHVHINREEWLNRSHEHFQRVGPRYEEGRAFEQGLVWAREIAANVPLSAKDWLLDVGCGTGLFTRAFGRVLSCQIAGLDPSQQMLGIAQQKDPDGGVGWARGAAEDLPFPDKSFKAVFLSQVWHHIADPDSAARSLANVLQKGGALFLKTFSHEQLRSRWDLNVVFPELMPFMLNVYADRDELEELLSSAGFNRFAFKSYRKQATMLPSTLLRIASERLWSMFSIISEEGREQGLSYLRALIQETNDAPVAYDELHFLVIAHK